MVAAFPHIPSIRVIFPATAQTIWSEHTPKKSQHRKLTLETKILPLFLPGIRTQNLWITNLVIHQLRYLNLLYLYNTMIIMNTYQTPDLKMSPVSASQRQLTMINNDNCKRRSISDDSSDIYFIFNILKINKKLYERKFELLASYQAHFQAKKL